MFPTINGLSLWGLWHISAVGGKQVCDRQVQYKNISNSATYG